MVGQLNRNQFPNIQALYHLGDTSDDSGNGNTLTNNGSVTFVPGKFGSAADFGTVANDKYLTQASALGYDGGAYSVLFWVNINVAIPAETIYNSVNIGDSTSSTQFQLSYSQLSSVKALNFGRTRRNVAADSFTYNVDLGVGTWHNIVQTYDGTTVTGYLNGKPVGSVASSGNGSGGEQGLIVNGQLNSPTTSNGLQMIEELVLVKAALTPKQIKDYYAWATGKRTSVA